MVAAPTFRFDEATSAHVPVFTKPGDSLSIVDNGVTFTVSATQLTGKIMGIHLPSFTSQGYGVFGFHTHVDGPDVVTISLKEGAKDQFSGTVSNPITLRGASGSVAGIWNVKFVGANGTGTVTRTLGRSTNITGVTGQFSSMVVSLKVSNGIPNTFLLSGMTATVNCFLTGTMIATPKGEVAIETLKAGDQVLRADGGVTTVKWLGEQKISTGFQHPAKVNPIRISAGALGDNLPKRDLFVTADHALGLDGMLVNAGALVNGTTIIQVQHMPRDGFSYWHVETEGHELILAEGCAAESFIDYVGRDGFDVATGEASSARIAEMPLPRVSSARHLPADIALRVAPAPQAA